MIQTVLDAAHIIDDASDGLADASNGLLLRADLHRLYDARPKKGRLGGKHHMNITSSGVVIFSPPLRNLPTN
jgi:hypothetical protein